MVFERSVVLEDWRSINLLILIGKIYAGILVDRDRRVTEDLNDGEQGVFRSGRGV